ncbi:transglutaminaseTgpA domain-containing protein [Neobacillus sp. DY30]|uniref:transglutaminase TgpA family protein n=1 Tax=Neobacillus sp. DY30 TaxID=3047871 RepID=UPI0024C0182F|nr:transglutaminaseTgpA domain-containing protein [Neobacillus sp. DY30]WHY01027.1 transglutaminaseTgpA domain-containing protein [Neobacillus sp. DY30]
MKRDFQSFLLYMFGFLLLWEWLRPIEQLTTTDHVEMFVIFILLSFTLAFLRMKWIWQMIIKVWFIAFSINMFHYGEGFYQFSWLSSFTNDLTTNVTMIVSRNWLGLTNEFRSFLLFILLWLMVYLVRYWLLNRKRIFIFFFMTLIYITVLDTFTLYSAKTSIIRTVVVGFAVMGMLTYYRILVKENVNSNSIAARKWMRPLVLMIAFSVIIGIIAPKFAPIWPDPVPYLKAASNKGGEEGPGNGIAKVGYGTDDSRLGGPFIGDDSIVFRSEAEEKNYWKVETKDHYTGKGWIPSELNPYRIGGEDLIPVSPIPATVETRDESASLFMFMDYDHLIYPAGIQRVQFQRNYILEIEATKEKISILNGFDSSPVAPDSYSVEYKVPEYRASELRETTTADQGQIDAEFLARYTQLPENIPKRVRELAQSITEKETNWFDKARAVERHFGDSGFTYSQSDVAVPGEDDDYVDQFLFDTKIGYCDNFSTSMAVMLRSIGIPTRWVKGYTGGKFLEYSEEHSSKQIYEITNNNAHSWVEVYFPNQGWVPFEPTKGFSNSVSIDFTNDDGTTPAAETTAPPAPKPQQNAEENSGSSQKTETTFSFNGFWLNLESVFRKNWKLVLFVVVVIIGAAGLMYRLRGKWIPRLYLLQFRLRKKDENIGKAYLILLDQLERYGLKRNQNQTLRSYARYIDTFFASREMSKLTDRYEQYLYHQKLTEGSWKDSRELWENLIKKTIA